MIMLLASSALLLAAATLGAHAVALRGSIERSVATLTIAQAVLSGILLVAGLVLHSLAPLTLFALSAGIFAAVLIALRPAGIRAALRSVAGTIDSAGRGLRESLAIPPVLGVWVVAALCLAWRAFLALRLGVLDYDGFSYHLVTVDMWLQADSIGRIPQRIWSDIYPANGELVTLWLMAFTRNDSLAALTALVSLPLAVVSTIGVARLLGARRPWALLAGGLLVITPAVIMLTPTTYVDILAAADLAAAWYFGLLALRERAPRRRTNLLLLAGIAIGLTIGTKQTVLLPAAALGALLLGATLAPLARAALAARRVGSLPGDDTREDVSSARPLAPRPSAGQLARELLAVSVPAVAFGSYWYLRNLVAYGNPFWPFTVGPFAGVGTFGEYLVGTALSFGGTPAAELVLRSWTADIGTSRYEFAPPLGGYGLQWLPALAMAAVAVSFLVTRARHTAEGRPQFVAAAVVVVLVSVTLLVTPMSWWARLVLFLVVAVLALAAVALSRLPPRVAVAIAIALAIGATWSVGIATATSNVPIENRYRIWSFDRLGRLALRDSEARGTLGYWAQCTGFRRIPSGALVAVDQLDLRRVSQDGQVRILGYGFNLLHLIVGHNLEHRLAAPIAPTDDPAQLESRARAVGATYLVLASGGPSAPAARRAPAVFKPLGAACMGALAIPEAEIFELTNRA